MDYAINEFTLCTRRLQLLRDQEPVPVEPQVFELLRLLIENADRVVTRDEIFRTVWDNRIVSDATLSSRIKVARALLGDDGNRQGMIRTVHGRGFHFVGPVTRCAPPADKPPLVPAQVPTRPSLAILPIRMLTPDPQQQAFGDGLADDILTALGRIQTLYVAESLDDADPRRVAKDLGVRYLLSVRLRFSGMTSRLNASLLHAVRMEEVWSERFSGSIDDVFAAQDRLAAAVLGALVPNLLMVEIRRAVTQDPEIQSAYDHLLRAIPLCWAGQPELNTRAMAHLNQAVESEPDHALSHALLAWCMAQHFMFGWSGDPTSWFTQCLERAHRALTLAPSDTVVLTFVAGAKVFVREFGPARHHLETALSLDPNFAWAQGLMGFVDALTGQPADAIRSFETALALSPHDHIRPHYFFGLGHSYFEMGDLVRAEEWFHRGLVENPTSPWGKRMLAVCAFEAGHVEQAEEMLAAARAQTPGMTARSVAESALSINAGVRARIETAFVGLGL